MRDLRIYGDINGNGIVDNGEPRFDNATTPIFLQPGQIHRCCGNRYRRATARRGPIRCPRADQCSDGNGALTAQNTDTIHRHSGAAVDVRKDASTRNATRGQTMYYDLIATSRGQRRAAPTIVIVDGARRDFVCCAIRFRPTPASSVGRPKRQRTNCSTTALATPKMSTPHGAARRHRCGRAGFDQLRARLDRARHVARAHQRQCERRLRQHRRLIYRDGNADARVFDALEYGQRRRAHRAADADLLYRLDYTREARVTGVIARSFCKAMPRPVTRIRPLRARDARFASTLTGDTIRTEMLETGPNTGVFPRRQSDCDRRRRRRGG